MDARGREFVVTQVRVPVGQLEQWQPGSASGGPMGERRSSVIEIILVILLAYIEIHVSHGGDFMRRS
jgi:hypothetical protein